jgi:hypothetical protein
MIFLRLRWYHIRNRWKWFWQRHKYGFDSRELWSLDYNISKFIVPRLQAYRKAHHGVPTKLVDEYGMDLAIIKWNKILDQMIFAFQFIINDNDNNNIEEFHKNWKKDYPQYQKGMKLFVEYFRSLWD